MANRYIRAAGGNYNAAGTWELTPGGGEAVAVPTSSDAVLAHATSGNLTVTAAAAAQSLSLTGYNGTLTINSGQTLTVSGTILLVSTMTLAGTGTLAPNATANLTSAGKVIPWNVNVGNVTITLSFVDDWTITGAVTIGNGSTQTLNGSTLYCGGSLTINGRCQGTTAIVLNGTGTLTGSATASRFISNPVTINTAGTLTLASTSLNIGCVFTYVAGTIALGTSTLYIGGSCTLSGAWPSLRAIDVLTSSTLTLTNPLTLTVQLRVGATLTMAGGQNVTVPTLSHLGSVSGTLTRDAGVWTITAINVPSSFSLTIGGATPQTVTDLTVNNGATLLFQSGQTLTVTGTLRGDTTLLQPAEIRAITASSAMTLALAGATVESCRMRYTDVTVTGQTLWNYLGGTLTRVSGIQNFTTTPGDNIDPGITNVANGVAYEINGAPLVGTLAGGGGTFGYGAG